MAGTPDAVASTAPLANARHELFAQEYILDLNATKAAIRAGYSAKTASSIGNQVLRRPEVSARVADLKKAQFARLGMNADDLLIRLIEEATADLADIFLPDGTPKNIHDWPKIWRTGLVAGIEVETKAVAGDVDKTMEQQGHGGALKRATANTSTIQKLKIADRGKRLELIGRHVLVQAFKDKLVHDVEKPLAELMEQIGGKAIRPREG